MSMKDIDDLLSKMRAREDRGRDNSIEIDTQVKLLAIVAKELRAIMVVLKKIERNTRP